MKNLALTIVFYSLFAATQSIPALCLMFWIATLVFASLTAKNYLER